MAVLKWFKIQIIYYAYNVKKVKENKKNDIDLKNI